MAEDLYRLDLQRVSSTELYDAVESFTSVKLPPDQRPQEGYLLDFKEDWSGRALQTVAAFANTFGGILLLGVSEQNARPNAIVGVPYRGELKLRIGSVISANLVPCPVFEIGECSLPSDANLKVCVVRVKESSEICLITKKGERPVRVRVENQSLEADASQLTALIQRNQSKQAFDGRVNQIYEAWSSGLYVTKVYKERPTQRVRSDTQLWAASFPVAHPEIETDLAGEKKFFSVIEKHFRNFGIEDERTEPGPRARKSYQIHRLILSHDFERVWQFDSSGSFGLASQTAWPDGAGGLIWSLYDLVIDLVSLLRASREFWESFGYFGSARLVVQLGINNLRLYYDHAGFHPILYANRFSSSSPLARAVFAISPTPTEGKPTVDLNVAFHEGEAFVVSRIVNQLMRALGHGAEIEALERSITGIVPPAPS
ncbi:MAG: AlbA family DNA-binding domain-containing protein [Terriglobia bacterium]